MRLSTFAFSAAALLIQKYADYYKQRDQSSALEELKGDYGFPRPRTWDFIIVGGGVAGCLLAERLSQKYTVLLLEKGGDPIPTSYNRRETMEVAKHPALNDIYSTVPQRKMYLDSGGVGSLKSGRVLGGSGSHSYNLYVRGSQLDYDHWANITGDESWRYDNMLRHFKDFENFVGTLLDETQRGKYFGGVGLLRIETVTPKWFSLWILAGLELGYLTQDLNTVQSPSFTTVQTTTRDHLRESSFTAFIQRQAANRSSLTILRYSTAQNVLINENNQAYGVAYTRHGIPEIACARKEVIISAGAFGSPSLLIKSGIGPQPLLREAGIPEVKNVPGVGRNLQDHLHLVLSFNIVNEYAAKEWLPFITESQVVTELDAFQGSQHQGVFADNSAPSALAFIATLRARLHGEQNWPNVHIGIETQVTVKPDTARILLHVVLGRPKSKGEINFNTSAYKNGEWEDAFLLRPDPKYLEDSVDLQDFIEGIRFGMTILEQTTPFSAWGLRYSDDNTPPSCRLMIPRTDAYWACVIGSIASSAGHRVGTCKMGKFDGTDPMVVLDSKFRVPGIKRLRVVDSSIFPQIPNGGITAPTLASAQKAANDILKDNP